jgi:hypothetical protein
VIDPDIIFELFARRGGRGAGGMVGPIGAAFAGVAFVGLIIGIMLGDWI